MRNRLICLMLLIGLPLFPSAWAANIHAAVRSPNDDSIIDVTVILPTEGRAPRAVVLSIPGASGIGDLELELQLIALSRNEQPTTAFLPYALAARGYAFAHFNYGGVLSRKRCVDPALPEERVSKFLDKCLDRKRNVKRGFSTAEKDIAAVRQWLSRSPIFGKVPVIVLAFSEGGQHVARLIRTGQIAVDGFIAVGAPTVSPADNVLSQMNRTLKYRRIKAYLDKHASEVLRTDDLPRIFEDEISIKYLQWSLRAQPTWTRAQLAVAEEIDVYLSTKAFQAAWQANGTKPLVTEFFGVEIEGFSSSAFIQEQLDDSNGMVQSLAQFEGKSIFLFGELDSVVDFSATTACGGLPSTRCGVKLVPGVGHVFILPRSQLLGLDPILQAVEDVL